MNRRHIVPFAKKESGVTVMALICWLLPSLTVGQPCLPRKSHPSFQHMECCPILDRKVTVIATKVSVLNAAFALSMYVPIGFVGVEGEDRRPKEISVKAIHRTIREVLDEIVQLDKRYKWEIRGGSINVYPVSTQDEIAELRIQSLELRCVRMLDVGSTILDAPEIHQTLEAMGKKSTNELNYSGRVYKNAKISEAFHNTSIREALNSLLVKGVARFWALDTFGEHDDLVRITVLD